MIVQFERIALLLSILVEAHGRPLGLQNTETYLSKLNFKSTETITIGGVTRDHVVNKLKYRVHAKNNYLKNTIFDNVLKRRGPQHRDIALVVPPLEKNRKSTGQIDKHNSALESGCGVRDKSTTKVAWNRLAKLKNLPRRVRTRFRRFATQGSKWPVFKYTLKWTVSKWSSKISKADTKQTLTKAFRAWAEVSPLKFRWESNPSLANIEIRFENGYHGCKQAFDGPGGILAHAYFPQFGGNIHFDEDEPWKPNSDSSSYKSLFKVAVHEIGHSLGLQHSDVSGAIMGRYYLNSGTTRLADDDIKGIQSIYGVCNPTRIDSIESSFYWGKTYIFKDLLYWKFDDLKSRVQWPDYPKGLVSGWSGIKNKIDEMFLWRRTMGLYFFSGNYYYYYDEYRDKVDDNSPKLISAGWPGVPNDIDAAMSIDDSTSYFFKGDYSYKYDSYLDKVVKKAKISTEWPGLPNNIDSAFVWYYDGKTYFFKDDYYYEWDYVANKPKTPQRIQDKWQNICDV